jgi:cytochrome c oxidase assembly protein subunit 11
MNSLFARRLHRHAASLVAVVVGMVLLSYASVPLYKMFCAATGFGGTTQVGSGSTTAIITHPIRVRFNADTDPALPWKFAPVARSVTVNPGENRLAFFTAENLSNTPIHGMATYNVIPHAMGRYFVKIQCFCFEEQVLAAGQKVTMPVSFYLDPALLNDPETKELQEVTLSYSFFEKKQ